MEKAYQQLIVKLSYDDHWLAKLDSFYDNYVNADNERLLHARVVSWKALVLSKIERFEEAIPYYLFAYENEDKQKLSFFNAAYGLSFAYFRLGVKDKAIRIISDFLGTDYPSQEFCKLSMLDLYVDILEINDLPPKYEKLLDSIVEFIGLDVNNFKNLNDRIKEVYQKNKIANRRYSEFLISLNGSNNNELEKVNKLREYLNSETVGYYRKLATNQLTRLTE